MSQVTPHSIARGSPPSVVSELRGGINAWLKVPGRPDNSGPRRPPPDWHLYAATGRWRAALKEASRRLWTAVCPEARGWSAGYPISGTGDEDALVRDVRCGTHRILEERVLNTTV